MNAKIEAYITEQKTKQGKANIRGFWLNNKGQIFYDYLHKANITEGQLVYAKKHYKQEAIFYRARRKGYIWHNERKQEVLNYQTYFGYTGKVGLKAYIKDILKKYGGLTIYIRQGQNYLIEAWR